MGRKVFPPKGQSFLSPQPSLHQPSDREKYPRWLFDGHLGMMVYLIWFPPLDLFCMPPTYRAGNSPFLDRHQDVHPTPRPPRSPGPGPRSPRRPLRRRRPGAPGGRRGPAGPPVHAAGAPHPTRRVPRQLLPRRRPATRPSRSHCNGPKCNGPSCFIISRNVPVLWGWWGVACCPQQPPLGRRPGFATLLNPPKHTATGAFGSTATLVYFTFPQSKSNHRPNRRPTLYTKPTCWQR